MLKSDNVVTLDFFLNKRRHKRYSYRQLLRFGSFSPTINFFENSETAIVKVESHESVNSRNSQSKGVKMFCSNIRTIQIRVTSLQWKKSLLKKHV